MDILGEKQGNKDDKKDEGVMDRDTSEKDKDKYILNSQTYTDNVN